MPAPALRSPIQHLNILKSSFASTKIKMASSTPIIDQKDLSSFHAHLKESKRVLALLGAGVSASSGLPTFRGAGGLWRTHDSISLASPGAFEENPGLVWQVSLTSMFPRYAVQHMSLPRSNGEMCYVSTIALLQASRTSVCSSGCLITDCSYSSTTTVDIWPWEPNPIQHTMLWLSWPRRCPSSKRSLRM
jgi:hypothetical protein